MDITIESVQEKLDKGETLTKEENEFIMSLPPEHGAESNIIVKDEEEINWEEAQDLDSENKKKEETPEEKKVREDKEAQDKKKQALTNKAKALGLKEDATEEEITTAEKKKKEEDEAKDPLFKIERELAKPEGQENLEGFTDREKAYFHQMRRDRKSRQKAEEERDAAKFKELQRQNKEKAEKETKPEEDPLSELKKRDKDDFLTVGEVVEILEKQKATPPAKEEPKKEGVDPVRARYLKMCDEEAREAHPEDYDVVMEMTDEIVSQNEGYLKEIAEAIAKGENPAERTYQLIKQDAEFSKLYPAAETKFKARKALEKKSESKTPEELEKEKKAKEAQEALEKNQNKTKTTGHAAAEGGGEAEKGTIDGYSITDIMKMSDLQFAKLPKKTREKFLQQYGA